MNETVARSSYEILVLGFDDVAVDTVRTLIDRIDHHDQVRVVTALIAARENDGTPVLAEWADPATVSDLTADLAARRLLGLDLIDDDLTAGLEPGETVAVLLVEHAWAQAVAADIAALGGRFLTSGALAPEDFRDGE
jgi:hypothetical protein